MRIEPMQISPDVSFVIPVRTAARTLEQCLRSIWRSAGDTAVEVIVANNGSTDDSAAIAQRAGARVFDLPGAAVAAVRNEAAKAATGRLLAFVDADHEIDEGWVAAAAAVFQDDAVAAAGAPYDSPPDGTWVQRAYAGLRQRCSEPSDADWLPSGNLIVRRSAFERIGGFDATLETCEDVDLCVRLRAAGFRIVQDPRLRSVHHGDPSTLTALFRGELWRGRDNLRVSLRRRPALRDVPSIVIPIADLMMLAVAALGLASLSPAGWTLAMTALGGIGLLAALRTRVMRVRLAAEASSPGGARTFVVALVYDTARALALTMRVTHDMRRS